MSSTINSSSIRRDVIPELHRFPEKSFYIFASRSCQDAILGAADRFSDGREWGGFLIGRLIEDGRIQLSEQWSPWFGDDVHRARTSVSLDVAAAIRMCEDLRANGHVDARDGVIGMYHTHPIEGDQSVAVSEPSGADRQNALEVAAIVGSDIIVDLILAERRNGSWHVEPWITRRDKQGKALTERAFLIVPERY
jgi:proteasome lid subunit RPN8/RPN11